MRPSWVPFTLDQLSDLRPIRFADRSISDDQLHGRQPYRSERQDAR
jgi:hypothetical protein